MAQQTANNQHKVLKAMEMFGSIFDTDTITGIMETCNWNLEACIEHLIHLSTDDGTSNTDNDKIDVKDKPQFFHHMDSKSRECVENVSTEIKDDKWTTIKRQRRFNVNSKNCTADVQNMKAEVNTCKEGSTFMNSCSIPTSNQEEMLKQHNNSCLILYSPLNPDNILQPALNSCKNIEGIMAGPSDSEILCANQLMNLGSTTFAQSFKNSDVVTFQKIIKSIENGYKILILLRGAPGSGKSYLGQHIIRSTIRENPADYVYSTDDYFVMLGRGRYAYDPGKVRAAHDWNQDRALLAMKSAKSPIIIDNTNTEFWEMYPYASMAVEHGYIVEILEPRTPWAHNVHKLAEKNQHGVPKAKIRQLIERFQKIDSGEALLRSFNLKYSSGMKVPQIRSIPPTSSALLSTNNEPITSNVNLQTHAASPDDMKNKDILNIDNHTDVTNSSHAECNIRSVSTIEEQTNSTGSTSVTQMVENSTNTYDEDFNFLRIVSSMKPEYKILSALKRNINEGLSPTKNGMKNTFELMCNKCCMTDQLLYDKDATFHLDNINEIEEDVAKLKDMFTDIPEDCLKQIYHQNDFDCDRTVDFLLEEKENFFFSEKCNIADENQDICEIDKDGASATSEIKNQKGFRFLSESSSSSDDDSFHNVHQTSSKDDNMSSMKECMKDSYRASCIIEPESVLNYCESNMRNGACTHTCADCTEVIDLNIGDDIFRILQHEFGTPEFTFPEGISPVVSIKRTWARILYELCVKNVQSQLDVKQKHLEQIQRDAEYAKFLEDEEMESRGITECNEEFMLSPPTQQHYREKLHKTFPSLDETTLNQILMAHDDNFEETLNVVKTSTGQFDVNSVVQNNNDKKIAAISDNADSDNLSYKDALKAARQARKEAHKYAILRNQNLQKAKNMCQKNPGIALYYTQTAQEHAKNMDKENAIAASAYLAAQTYVLGQENILDLHNLYCTEAMQALDIFLDHHLKKLQGENEQLATVYVITGWGAHSNNGYSKIKEAVTKKLNANNIKFVNDNPGRFKITLEKSTSC